MSVTGVSTRRTSGGRRARGRAAALAALLGCCLAPAGARAGGGIVPEMGARKTGMGAVVGRPDELAAIYHNPAGLVLSPGTNLYLSAGVSLLDLGLRIRPWQGSGDYIDAPVDAAGYYPEVTPSRAFGVVPMLVGSTSLLSDRLVLALGLYLPNAVGAAFDADSLARYHIIDSYAVTGAATAAAACRLHETLAVGVGLRLLYMRFAARRELFPVLEGLDLGLLLGGHSVLEMSGDDVTVGGSVGLLWQPLPFVSVGLALITRADTTVEGDVTLTLGEDALSPGQTLEGTQRTGLFLPWTVQAGLHLDLTSWLEVGLEWRYFVWRQLKQQRTTVEGIDLIDELVVPRRYIDSIHIGGGVRVQPPWLADLELMLGMHWDTTPAPDPNVSVEQPTFTHVGLRTGVRYRVARSLRLAASYVHYWYTGRGTDESVTTPPSNFRGDGVNHIATVVVEWRVAGPPD